MLCEGERSHEEFWPAPFAWASSAHVMSVRSDLSIRNPHRVERIRTQHPRPGDSRSRRSRHLWRYRPHRGATHRRIRHPPRAGSAGRRYHPARAHVRAKLAVIGCVLGLVGAYGVSRAFAAAFPGMHMSNMSVVFGATVLLLAVAQIACYLPARYASRTSPTEALRAE